MKCKKCYQKRNKTSDGICILCKRGPGGNPVEVKTTLGIRYRGKEIKESSKENLKEKLVFSTGNEGVKKKPKKNNI